MTRKTFKKKVSAIIQASTKLIIYINRSTDNGLSAITEEFGVNEDYYFKEGLTLLKHDAPAAVIDEIYTNRIACAKGEYDRRYRTIIRRAILAIKERLEPEQLIFIIFSLANLSIQEEIWL